MGWEGRWALHLMTEPWAWWVLHLWDERDQGVVAIVPVGVGVARWASRLATKPWVWWASRPWDERDQDVVCIVPVGVGRAR